MGLTWRFFTMFLIGSTLMAACNLPGNSPVNRTGLEATQTLQALATEVESTLAAAAAGGSAQPANTTLPTGTSLPVETPAPEQIATPTLISPATPTETSSAPVAHVNTNTNCRSGPSTAFGQLYVAQAGEDLKVVSRTTFTDYVLVENPKKPEGTCWLWTRYVDLSGDINSLPLVTPPPTPTPVMDFKVSYTSLGSCVEWVPELKVINTGGVTFKSAKVIMQDKDTRVKADATTNSFSRLIDCIYSPWTPELAPGETGYLYASFKLFDLHGHKLSATVILCTEDDLMGTCISKDIQFTT